MIIIRVLRNGGREGPNSEATGKEGRRRKMYAIVTCSSYGNLPPEATPKVDHDYAACAPEPVLTTPRSPPALPSPSSADWKPIQVRFAGAPSANGVIYG
jgi:hypothetical protein